ncbi:hypothetical protein OC845_001816 [Tilletia horrida]|nr:hypothetical protein OC845_001816 [Tilletia horrida]
MVLRSSASAAVHYLRPAVTATASSSASASASASTSALRSTFVASSSSSSSASSSSRSSYASSSSSSISAAVSQLEAGVLSIVQGMARRELAPDSTALSPATSSRRPPAPSRMADEDDDHSIARQQARALLRINAAGQPQRRGQSKNHPSSQCSECREAAQRRSSADKTSEHTTLQPRHDNDPPSTSTSLPLSSRTEARRQKQLYAEIVEALARDSSVPVEDVFAFFRLDPYGRDLVLPFPLSPTSGLFPDNTSPHADLSQLLNPPSTGSNFSKRQWLTSVVNVKSNRTAYAFAIRGLAHRNEFEAADMLFHAFLRRGRQRRRVQEEAEGGPMAEHRATLGGEQAAGPEHSGANRTFDLDAFMLTFRWTAETLRVKSFTRTGKGTSPHPHGTPSTSSPDIISTSTHIGEGTHPHSNSNSNDNYLPYQRANERNASPRTTKRERDWPHRTRGEARRALAEILSFIDVRASDFDQLPEGIKTRAVAFPGCALPFELAPILRYLPSDKDHTSSSHRTNAVEPSPQLMTNIVYSLSKHWATHRAAIATWIAMERRWPLHVRENGMLNALVLSARSLAEAVSLRQQEKMRWRREGRPVWYLTHSGRRQYSKGRKNVGGGGGEEEGEVVLVEAEGGESMQESAAASGRFCAAVPQRPSPSTSIWSYSSLAHDLRALMLARAQFRAWLFLAFPDMAPGGHRAQAIPEWLPAGHRMIANRVMMGSDQVLDLLGSRHAGLGLQLLAREGAPGEEEEEESDHPAPTSGSTDRGEGRNMLTFDAGVFHAYAQLVAAMVEMRYLPTPHPRRTRPSRQTSPSSQDQEQDTINEEEEDTSWPPPRYAFALPRPWPNVDELVRILVWMRELKVEPWEQTLCLIADSVRRYYHRHQLIWPKRSSSIQQPQALDAASHRHHTSTGPGLSPMSSKNRFEGMGPLSDWMSGWEGLEERGLTTLEVRNYAKYLRTAVKVPMRPIWERARDGYDGDGHPHQRWS